MIDKTACASGFASRLHSFALSVRVKLARVSIAHIQNFFSAVHAMPEPERLQSVYWAGRLTLCASPEDLALYEACWKAFFEHDADLSVTQQQRSTERVTGVLASRGEDAVADQQQTPDALALSANEIDILRQRDFAGLSLVELDEMLRLVEALRFKRPIKRYRQKIASHLGAVHARRTVRAAIENHAEITRLILARPDVRARRCVLLFDVSGSMRPYADPLLRFGYAMAHSMPRSTEVFSLSSRLARLTPALSGVCPQVAMAAVSKIMPGWGGGTRLGAGLQSFLDTWGQRGMARGAIVVIASDGWESGGAELLAGQMSRLRRLAHWIIWVNPHKSSEGFEPVTAGMKAALPYVDCFLGGASLEELIALGGTIAAVPASARKHRRRDFLQAP